MARSLSTIACAAAGVATTLCALASPAPAQNLTTELYLGGLSSPVAMRQPDGEQRIFILSERRGIHVVDNGVLQPTLFLDLSAEPGQGIEGICGMAFHPDYVNNGRLWVSWMDASQVTHVMEYTRDANDPNKADVSSAVHLFGPTLQPSNIHNWYDMHFGPDGMLYLAFGDGGGAHDPNGYAQDLTTTFGKILRVDVNTGTPGTYAIPPDNPFVGQPGAAEEIWHYGVRSPWRFSFDRDTGDFWLGDVGQATREEINFAAAGTSGVNFGWRCMEGFLCTMLPACACQQPNWTEPVIDFDHSQGCAVMGGHVYRGDDIPWLDGTYFYGDFCTGRIWTLEYDGTTVTNHVERTAELAPTGGSISIVTGFAEDGDGEMYVFDRLGGEIWKIVEDECDPAPNYCTTSPNSAGTGAVITTVGCASVGLNELELVASGVPAHQYGMFFYGPQQTAAPFGQGTLCITGPSGVFRLKPPVRADPAGVARRPLDLTVPPASGGAGLINAGTTMHFQFWYRDPGFGFNLSDACTVVFTP